MKSIRGIQLRMMGAALIALIFYFVPSSFAGKSLWELRGQTVEKEVREGKPTQAQVPTQEAEPTVSQIATQTVAKEKEEKTESAVATLVDSITIPSQYGRVKERFKGSGDRLLVLLQEIHNHPEVQKNNTENMKTLLDQYQIPLILIEGYYGPLTAPTLRSQDKAWREKFAKDRLDSGYYNAEEYLYLTRDIPPTIIGVDDARIVKEQYDLTHYKYLLDNRTRAESVFKRSDEAMTKAKEKLYNSALKKFDSSAQEYTKDQISSTEFVNVLKQALKDQGKTLSESTYPNIAWVIKGTESEDQDAFDKSQEYLQKVDHAKLFVEIKGLEKEVRSHWYQGSQEQKLDRLAKGLFYFEKLSKISLIPIEWEEYRVDLAPFSISELAQFLKENGITADFSNDEVAFLDQYRKEGETFYQIAIDRERTMVENSLAALSEHRVNKAILKTGGFHTSGISQFLRSNHISYVVIAPKVTQPDMPTPYQDFLKKSMDKLSNTMQGQGTAAGTLAQRRAVKPAMEIEEDRKIKK